MSTKGIKGLTDNTIEKIKEMVDSNTIIGESIKGPNGTVIIPVSRVQVGFASGGIELDEKGEVKVQEGRIGGGSGGGLKIEPVAFLVITNEGVKLMQIADKNQTIDRALNLLPGLIDQLVKKMNPDKEENTKIGDSQVEKVGEVILEKPSTDSIY